MKARIHFTVKNSPTPGFGNYEDSIVLEGSPEEIREQADVELAKRGGVDPWSEVIEE